MVEIKVDVITDVVCAWSYVGKRTLEKSIQLYQKTYPGGKHDTFKIMWRPYYLNYNPSAQSIEKSELAKVKLAGWSEERVAAVTKRMKQIGTAVGIDFKSGGKIGNTHDAHRLIHLSHSKSPAIQDAVVENIFRAHHEQERDISDHTVLRDITSAAGLPEVEVDQLLSSDQYGQIVDEQAQSNREKVISGVPTFFVQDQHRVDGAQELTEFMEAFIKVRESSILTE